MKLNRESATPYLTTDPPHWAARGLSYLLIVIFIAAAAGAILIEAPETVTAEFVLAPRLGADPVRAMRGGIIQQVKLVEGRTVSKGDTLFIIRSEQTGDQSADLRASEAQLRGAGESLTLAAEKYRNQQLAAAEERRRLQGQIEHLDRLIALKSGELALAREVAESYTQLRREGLAGTTVIKEKQTEVSRLTGQLELLRNEQRDTRAALEKLSLDEQLQLNEYRQRERALKDEIEKAKIMIATRSQWVTQNQGTEFVTMAPCSGTILKLHVKTSATVVAEGEVLCELSCTGERLQAEIRIPQVGAGRVRAGQDVKLLYDSFPYQQFGVKYARLRWISPTTSTPEFRAIADLDDESIDVGGRPTPLRAGMGGRAEVVIARRSLISIAFDPIRQLRENLASPPERRAPGTEGHQ